MYRVTVTRLKEAKWAAGIKTDYKRVRYKLVHRKGKKVPLHRVLAEEALGKPLPPGAIVHHLDLNPYNNTKTNLVICPDGEYHKLLHKRTEALNKTPPDLSDLGL